MVYISTQNLQSAMRQPILQTQSDLATVQKEIGSGVYADFGLQLGGQTSRAISLAQQSDQITSISNSNATVTARLSATDSALTAIMANAQTLSNNLLSDSLTGGVLTTLQPEAQTSLQSLIGQLNTSVAGQYIFGGTNTQTVPLNSYATSQSATSTAITNDLAGLNADSSQITGSQMTAYLADQTSASSFASLYQGTGWSTLANASTTQLKSQISPAQSVTTSVTASQAAFQNIAQAYSMLAEMANQNLGKDATQAVIASATKLLNAGITSLTQIQANLGTIQNSVSDANTQMTAQQTILTQNVSDLEDVDPTVLSTKVTALQTQLQDSYSVTSQLKSLSLVNYLTGG